MDSPSSLHTTDTASQPEVRRQLHKTWKEIEDVQQQIRHAVDEIAKANASLSKLRMLEKELYETAAATALLISPSKYQHIPVDLIGEIAGHLFPRPSKISPHDEYAYFREYFSLHRISDGPWPLTYVCRSWRTGILSLPWLWSSFSITTNRSNPQLLSTVIQRTANHLLSLSVSLSSEGASDAIISLLVNHSRRWKNIMLLGTTGPTPLLPLRSQLPELETLELRLWRKSIGGDPWLNSNEEQSIFEDAPKLVQLRLGTTPNTDGGVRVDLKFPLCQMQKVSQICHRDDLEPLFTLENLSSFANVTDLRLDVAYPTPLAIDIVTLPRVTSLKLESASILTSLRLPSLTSLEFESKVFKDNGDDTAETITAFFTAQSESFNNWGLGTLTVRRGSLCDRFIDILLHAALKNLHTLCCDYGEFLSSDQERWERMSDILTLLIWTPPLEDPNLIELIDSEWHWTNVMPHLQNLTLYFSCSWPEHGLFDLLREVILSRMNVDYVVEAAHQDAEMHHADAIRGQVDDAPLESIPARLKSFRIRYMDEMPDDITMRDLDMLREGKFYVTLTSPGF